jgi:O-antigen/teichoic acid export membrane protein
VYKNIFTKHFWKADFFRNVITLLTGNTIAQAISLLAIPLLTRLYTPEEFGSVALFLSIANVLAIASTGRYDMAIVPAKRSGEAFHLMVGSIVLSLIFSTILLILLVFIKSKVVHFFGDKSFNTILWFIPLLVFLIGSHKSFHYWFNRRRNYKTLAVNRVAQSSTQTAAKLARNLFSNGYWGLAIGTIVGESIAWVHFMYRFIRTDLWRFKYLSYKKTFLAFKQYANFPKYLMPMGVINTISVHILIFSLSAIASSAFVGLYERAWRVINLPLSLMSNAFGSVFFEKMTKTQFPKKVYVASYFVNLTIAAVILLPIALWGELIFGFVLGNDWEVAGKIARLILPLTVFGYATECVSSIFSVTRKNQLLLIWQILYLFFVLGWIIFAKSFDIYILLAVYSAIGTAMYAILAFIGFTTINRLELKPKND